MSFTDHWRAQIQPSLTQFARLAVSAPEMDVSHGLLAAAILWPIRELLQEFDEEALNALREIVGKTAKHILKVVQGWGDEPQMVVHSLTGQARETPELAAALNSLILYFQVVGPFAEQAAQALAQQHGNGDVYHVADQIKAALVNIGGVTNIHALTIQLSLAAPVLEPAKTETPPLPYEPETLLIPAGPFVLGLSAERGGRVYEGPPHRVSLPGYRIGKYPVTNEQYAEFVRKTGRLVAPETGWVGQHPPSDKLNHPVQGLTWFEALAYCRWLSQQTGRRYTLPSEAQWEKAARGSTGDRLYPWGDTWQKDRCCHDAPETAPVDAYPPQSGYGCHDLVGNIREWTRSLWGERRQAPDPRYTYPWPADGREDGRNDTEARANIYRVYRGGAAGDEISQLTCSARNGYVPDRPGPRNRRHGFRVVQELT